MLRSMYAGISGMKANQVKLDVIGNNISNAGTTSFKGARVRFQDMVSQSMSQALGPGTNQGGVNPKQVGLGVQVAGIDTLVGQGMMQPTSRKLDVAMDGEGYFMVAKGKKPTEEEGNTGIVLSDKDNTISSGQNLAPLYTRDGSFTLDNEGNLLTSDGLRVMGYAITGEGAKDPADPNAEGAEATSLVYSTANTDGTGRDINYVNADSKVIKTSSILVPLVIPDKVVVGDATADPLVTKRIRTFSIEKDGMIKAVCEDGSVAALGQIAVASFKNPAGLSKEGGNLYTNTANSGVAVVRTGKGQGGDTPVLDNGKGYGDMLQGMLEMSNVDLAEQFTDMIVTTRAFQAAGKTISTGDEILQDIINLKR